MAVATTAALALAGLESAKLLLKQFPNYDQNKRKIFEADYEIYFLQKTLPDEHPNINDSLFLRVRNRLLVNVQEINAFAAANGQTSLHV